MRRWQWLASAGFCVLVGCHDEAPAGVSGASNPVADLPAGGAPTGSEPEREVVAASLPPAVPQGPAAKGEAVTPPPVTLDGRNHPFAVSAVAPGRPRIYARSPHAWVHERADSSSRRLGYLRAGASSPTAPESVGRRGCPGGWYPVEPRGFVCAGAAATLDAKDPVVIATREYPPDPTRKLPYIYGTVRKPGPIYGRLPSAEELGASEPGHPERMARWLVAQGEVGAGYAQEVWLGGSQPRREPKAAWDARLSEGIPEFLKRGAGVPRFAGRDVESELVLGPMRPRAGYAFLRTFYHHGRRYGLTTDLSLMATDRLRPIRGSDFHGVVIGEDVDLPFAFVRHIKARFKIYQASTRRVIDGPAAPYRAVLPLSGKQKFFSGRLHYETEDGRWISDLHASKVRPAKRMPGWGKNGEKWIDVNLTKQLLMLYEGEKPVYATLISSGEAGLEDAEHTTATKRGIFRIHTKHVAATMSSDEVGEQFELRDVPYVQYFEKEGYALHGAYWHDRFGTPKSHGCLNLSPEDARRIFFWTEPSVPVGWHGVLLPLRGTVIFIHP